MSLHITAYGEGYIIMGSDSRVTLRRYSRDEKGFFRLSGVETQDDAVKLFAVNGRAALSLSGSLDFGGEDILQYIPRFIERRGEDCADAEKTAVALLESFRGGFGLPDTCFHIGSFGEGGEMSVCRVLLKERRIERMNCRKAGIIYNGDVPVVKTLLRGGTDFLASAEGAADFVREALERTGEELPLQDGVRTVGGPVRMLKIDSAGLTWL